MSKEFFIQMCVISWNGWRFHPGNDGHLALSSSELVDMAEALWESMQR